MTTYLTTIGTRISKRSLFHKLITGCGPVGRALDLGSRRREFESPHSDQRTGVGLCRLLFFLLMGDSNIQMQQSGGLLLAASLMVATPKFNQIPPSPPRSMVLITIHRKPLESLAVFAFSEAWILLIFHVYKMSAVGIRTLDGTV